MNVSFYNAIKEIMISARNKVYQTANFAMVEAYWIFLCGCIPVPEERIPPIRGRKPLFRNRDTAFNGLLLASLLA